ncbi:Methyltransferase domain-containing protein [Singulisphaera sp. GP187]|uniref:class I SAM-dependent methyltransferase n=1 Tax=Singulisphaera sp. GP187 TaxID=1882752 RepID=UPI000929E57D|nr:methyltransferase domain-containing protein [Singulisphaera sp. GP187]SIO61502.1 Methyltransferase domain-containing protein [Singulisphaera sp. GP187]
MNTELTDLSAAWAPYLQRYREGEWRDRIFRDLLADDARRMGSGSTILDIGCGRGLDGSVLLQRSIAELADHYIGIEPDPEIPLADYFDETHHALFESAPIRPGSIDLAFAVMVLEHLPTPQCFWDKLWESLREGGVFWAMTVDGRHSFAQASRWADRCRLKSWYLNRLHGQRGSERYEDYPVYYRTNTPDQVRRFAGKFQSVDCVNLSRVGQWSSYLPRPLRPLADFGDRLAIRNSRPGTLLIIRAVK